MKTKQETSRPVLLFKTFIILEGLSTHRITLRGTFTPSSSPLIQLLPHPITCMAD